MDMRIEPELILTGLEVKDSEEVISRLANLLFEHGYVRHSFAAGVLEREKVFPTGLPTPDYQVAIPHTDAEHVINQGLAIAILNKPVPFGEMGTTDTQINVRIVCMLALKENDLIIEFLQQLIEVFQHPGFLQRMIDSTPQEIANLFTNRIFNSLEV